MRPVKKDTRPAILPEHVRRVRLGHGANCSSIGSVLDLLFATAAVGSVAFAAAAAAIGSAADETRAAPSDRDHGDVDGARVEPGSRETPEANTPPPKAGEETR